MSTALAEAPRIGRPPVFTSPDEMQEAIDAYFMACDIKEKPYTMSGLAYWLGMNRLTLVNYENTDRAGAQGSRDPRFISTVKQARARVEQYVEEQSLSRDRQVAGHIFNLKNNFGWRDTQEIEHTHTLVMLGTGEQPLAPPALPDITVDALSPSLSEDLHRLSPSVNSVQGRITSVMNTEE